MSGIYNPGAIQQAHCVEYTEAPETKRWKGLSHPHVTHLIVQALEMLFMYSLIYLLIRGLLSSPILLIIHCIQEALGGGLKPQVQKKNKIWNWAYNTLQ